MRQAYAVDYFDYVQKSTSWPVVDFTDGSYEVTEDIESTALLNALHEAASKLSYYNAGEGDCRRQEQNARAAAHDNFHTLKKLAEERGIYDPKAFGYYLI